MIEVVEYRGWKNNLSIRNANFEIIVTLDVGPRVIAYRALNGFNVMKNYDEQMGKTGEEEWQIRGGLRFWLSPEDTTRTYYADNAPVRYEKLGDYGARFIPPPEKEYGIQKVLEIQLHESKSFANISLKVTNIGSKSTLLAPWAPTVMAPGGVEVIPLPAKYPHPGHPKNAKSAADFAPNQDLILWPYFDFRDSRWYFGSKYIMLHQNPQKGPTKIGLAHRLGWVAYWNQGTVFVKHIPYTEGAVYPDSGTNYQTFSNEDMLEMETVGVLTSLAPNTTAELQESWELFLQVPEFRTESEIDRLLLPLLNS